MRSDRTLKGASSAVPAWHQDRIYQTASASGECPVPPRDKLLQTLDGLFRRASEQRPLPHQGSPVCWTRRGWGQGRPWKQCLAVLKGKALSKAGRCAHRAMCPQGEEENDTGRERNKSHRRTRDPGRNGHPSTATKTLPRAVN